jgi:hypothetical protein
MSSSSLHSPHCPLYYGSTSSISSTYHRYLSLAQISPVYCLKYTGSPTIDTTTDHEHHTYRRPVTPSLYPIALQHTVRILPTSDPSIILSARTPMTIVLSLNQRLSPSSASTHRIQYPIKHLGASPPICGLLAVSKSQTICRVIMVYSPTKMQQFILSSANAVVYFPTNIHHFPTDSQIRRISGLLSLQDASILPPFS